MSPKDVEANQTYVDFGVTFAKMPSYIALLQVKLAGDMFRGCECSILPEYAHATTSAKVAGRHDKQRVDVK